MVPQNGASCLDTLEPCPAQGALCELNALNEIFIINSAEQAIHNVQELDLQTIKICTDASKNGTFTGYAVVVSDHIENLMYDAIRKNEFFVYYGVLCDVMAVLKTGSSNNLTKIHLFTDSQAVLRGLISTQIYSKDFSTAMVVQEIQRSISSGCSTEIFWVLRHTGVADIGFADHHASSKQRDSDQHYLKYVPVSPIKALLRNKLYKLWQQDWSTGSMGRDLFFIQNKVGS